MLDSVSLVTSSRPHCLLTTFKLLTKNDISHRVVRTRVSTTRTVTLLTSGGVVCQPASMLKAHALNIASDVLLSLN